MKRKLTLLTACALLLTAMPAMPVSAAETGVLDICRMGDINNDYQVGADDAQQALNIYVDSLAEIASNQVDLYTYAADINMDGVIDAEDAQNILNYYCQTLAGHQPLWADYRKLSYQSGSDFDPIRVDPTSPRPPAGYSFALRGMYLEIGCAEGKPGELVTVPVYVAGLKGLAGFQYFQNIPQGLALTKITTALDELSGLNDPDAGKNPDNGALVWVADGGRNIEVADGCVIAEYTYRIPEDAVTGDVFYLTANTAKTMFITEDVTFSAHDGQIPYAYAYTLLNGVIVVK